MRRKAGLPAAAATKHDEELLKCAEHSFPDPGARIKEFYALSSRYDTAIIAEAPDDATMAKVALALGSRGNIRSESLRAFTEDEHRNMTAGLPGARQGWPLRQAVQAF